MKITIYKKYGNRRGFYYILNKKVRCLEIAIYFWVILICWGKTE